MYKPMSNNFSRVLNLAICISCLFSMLSCNVQQPELPAEVAKAVENTGHLKDITNPMIEEPGMSDPHMLVIGDTCYVFTGHDVGFGVSDWVMPDYRIYRSTDLKSWEHVGTIKPEDTYMGAGHTSCWAGDIATRNGKYY